MAGREGWQGQEGLQGSVVNFHCLVHIHQLKLPVFTRTFQNFDSMGTFRYKNYIIITTQSIQMTKILRTLPFSWVTPAEGCQAEAVTRLLQSGLYSPLSTVRSVQLGVGRKAKAEN